VDPSRFLQQQTIVTAWRASWKKKGRGAGWPRPPCPARFCHSAALYHGLAEAAQLGCGLVAFSLFCAHVARQDRQGPGMPARHRNKNEIPPQNLTEWRFRSLWERTSAGPGADRAGRRPSTSASSVVPTWAWHLGSGGGQNCAGRVRRDRLRKHARFSRPPVAYKNRPQGRGAGACTQGNVTSPIWFLQQAVVKFRCRRLHPGECNEPARRRAGSNRKTPRT